jgi:two-component system sensor histidine kinase/response regulator
MNEPNPAPWSDPAHSLVLVVDDVPRNIQVVGNTLRQAGYQVAFAHSAAQAWSRLTESRPDLILLDVRMPVMDGYEFCRRLRLDPDLRLIPVIFLTAAVETDQVLRGFAMGAVDYVTKPFNSAELLARVHIHIELKLARDTLARQFREQRILLEEKTELIRLLGHNLRNPLWAILDFSRRLASHPGALPLDLSRIAPHVGDAAQRMMAFVNDLLDIEALDHGSFQAEIEEFNLGEAVASVVGLFQLEAARKQQSLEWFAPADPIPVRTDRKWVSQIIENLLSNAIKYSPAAMPIRVTVRREEDRAFCEVTDAGPGIPLDEQPRLFQKFGRLSAKPTGGEPSTGLGLSIAKRLANLLDADIRCRSQPDREPGCRFILELPATAQ